MKQIIYEKWVGREDLPNMRACNICNGVERLGCAHHNRPDDEGRCLENIVSICYLVSPGIGLEEMVSWLGGNRQEGCSNRHRCVGSATNEDSETNDLEDEAQLQSASHGSQAAAVSAVWRLTDGAGATPEVAARTPATNRTAAGRLDFVLQACLHTDCSTVPACADNCLFAL